MSPDPVPTSGQSVNELERRTRCRGRVDDPKSGLLLTRHVGVSGADSTEGLSSTFRSWFSRGVLLASRQHRTPPKGGEQKALRALARAGCGEEELLRIATYLKQVTQSSDECADRLSEIADFASAIGVRASRDYFRAIHETNALDVLMGPRVLEFARKVDRHTAEWYFWAVWGTKAVKELTDDRVLQAIENFRSVDGSAVVEYFLAIRETKATVRLTSPEVLSTARSLGSEAAVELFGACWETKAVSTLTDARILGFARSLGSDAAKEFFLAIRETGSVPELTDARVLDFVGTLGRGAAEDYFRAVRKTRAAMELTNDRVLLFAESIGRASAQKYFQVIGSTRAVEELTSNSILGMSGVIRSIGSDAALDYFLAAAAKKGEPSTKEPTPGPVPPTRDGSVPLLTLLDIPKYNGYRTVALLGVTALFWVSIWGLGGVMAGGVSLLLEVVAALVAWVILLGAGNVLLGKIAERSADEFLKQRRRLLNEHGIRWHDCREADQHCSLCWESDHTHADGRFDFERFCRCPACHERSSRTAASVHQFEALDSSA